MLSTSEEDELDENLFGNDPPGIIPDTLIATAAAASSEAESNSGNGDESGSSDGGAEAESSSSDTDVDSDESVYFQHEDAVEDLGQGEDVEQEEDVEQGEEADESVVALLLPFCEVVDVHEDSWFMIEISLCSRRKSIFIKFRFQDRIWATLHTRMTPSLDKSDCIISKLSENIWCCINKC